MTDVISLPFDLPSVRRKKLTADFEGSDQSSDGGLLLLREAERKLGVCGRLAEAMPDHRDTDRVRHAMFEMVMARVCAIACGHEDGPSYVDRVLRGVPVNELPVQFPTRLSFVVNLKTARVGAELLPQMAQAQKVLPTIGFLHPGPQSVVPQTFPLELYQGLADNGWVVSGNVNIEYRWA
jgi:Transposase DDE domain group 1